MLDSYTLEKIRRKRPLGITFLALYECTLVAMFLFRGLIYSSSYNLIDAVFTFLSAIVAYGLWNLKPWARLFWLMIAGLGFLSTIILVGIGGISVPPLLQLVYAVNVIIGGGGFYYLTRPQIKGAFERT